MSNFNTVKIDELFKNIDIDKTVKIYSLIDYFFNINSKNIVITDRNYFKDKIIELIDDYNIYSFKIFNYYIPKLIDNLEKIEKSPNINKNIMDKNTKIGEIAFIINSIILSIGTFTDSKSGNKNRTHKSNKNLLVYTIINICKCIYRYDNICDKLIINVQNTGLKMGLKNMNTPDYFIETLSHMR